MKTVHYVQVALYALACAALALGADLPAYAPVEHAVASVATAVMLALGLASGPVGQSPPMPAAPALPPPNPEVKP